MGMGRAFVALADDSHTVFVNPAGLSTFRTFKLSSMYAKVLGEVDYISLSGGFPTDWGSFGIGYLRTAISGIEKRDTAGALTGNFESSNNIFLLSYGVGPFWNTTFGITLKVFSKNLDTNSAKGLDLDLGILSVPSTWYKIGLSVLNVVPSTLGAKLVWNTNQEEGIPAIAKLGAALQILDKSEGLFKLGDNQLMATMDLDYRVQATENSGRFLCHLGTEWWPTHFLALRAGIDQSGSEQSNLTAGVGLRFSGFSFDYAYHPFSEIGSDTTHFFSISYSLPEVIPKKVLISKKIFKRVTFRDVPANYWARNSIETLASLKIVNGFEDNKFYPARHVNRAEMAAILAKAQIVQNLPRPKRIFKDVSRNHWAASSIEWATNQKFMKGYTDGTFRPNREISLAEAVVIIARFEGLHDPGGVDQSPFPGLDVNHWATRTVAVAKEKGLLKDFEGKNFNPNSIIRRDQLAQILVMTGVVKERAKYYFGEGEENGK